MKSAKRSVLIILIFIICVGCDQATKTVAKSVLSETGPVSFYNNTIRFQLALNKGAFMSLGAHLPETTRRAIFLIGAGGVLAGLLLFTLLHKPSDPVHLLSLSLMVGGGFGNLIDRAVFGGKVIDFMNIGVGSLRTGIFNVADVAITFGFILFSWSLIRARKTTPQDRGN